jgi:hypothetical protein
MSSPWDAQMDAICAYVDIGGISLSSQAPDAIILWTKERESRCGVSDSPAGKRQAGS